MTDASIETGEIRPGVAVTDLVAAGSHKGALARLDQQIVETVLRTSELASGSPGMMLPTDPAFAGQVAAVRHAAKSDMSGADQTAIREFVLLFAQRRNLPAPSSLGLDLDAAVMSAWPADLFAKAARLVWEQFAEMRVPNPPDFRTFIADDLAERERRIAALHTLEKRLETIARNGGQQIPADTFGVE
jgi:hypothetical protein